MGSRDTTFIANEANTGECGCNSGQVGFLILKLRIGETYYTQTVLDCFKFSYPGACVCKNYSVEKQSRMYASSREE